MTTRYWTGSSTTNPTDYFEAQNWNPPGAPVSGDVLFIDLPGASVEIDQAGASIDDVTITLGSSAFERPAVLTVGDATLGSGVVLTTNVVQPYASLVLSAQSTFDGKAVVNGGNLVVDGDLTGNGTIVVQRGGDVTLGTVAASQTIRFADDNGTLTLTDPQNFDGTITNFQAGDRILFTDAVSPAVAAASYENGNLVLKASDGTIITSLDVEPAGAVPRFSVETYSGGVAVVSSDDSLVWQGGDGDWYDAANWCAGGGSGSCENDIPLGGDSVSIQSGNVTISAADFAQYGALDFTHIALGKVTESAPVSLTLPHGYTIGSESVIEVIGSLADGGDPSATIVAPGITQLEGDLRVSSIGGLLQIQIAPDIDGQTGSFNISYSGEEYYGSLFVGQDSGLLVTGGTILNEDLVYIEGRAVFDATTTLTGGGWTWVKEGGRLELDGAALAEARIAFGTNSGTLVLGSPSQFAASIQLGQAGDEIVLDGLAATQLVYGSGVLTLFDAGGQQLASLKIDVAPHVLPDLETSDFTLASANGNATVTFTPKPMELQESLPVPAVGNPGDTIALADLLEQAFGSSAPNGFETIKLEEFYTGKGNVFTQDAILPDGDAKKGDTETSYWGIDAGAQNSYWLYNGERIGATGLKQISASEIDNVELVVGNSIVRTAALSVLTAGTVDDPQLYRTYNIWTSQPDVYVDGFDPDRLDPGDIVAAAQRLEQVYPDIPNDNNCNWIGDNVAAASGAVLPYENYADVPAQNVSGGFWRVIYRGDDPSDNPVQDWSGLVQPGDVVRMTWRGSGSPHTTTVTGPLENGYITVYDNDDFKEPGGLRHYIDFHQADYWTETTVEGTTIYRLDPDHQYLVEGTRFSETIQGSIYDNLIRPNGGADVITGGRGNNEIQGTTAELNGITITDWHDGNWIEASDLVFGTASVSYNASLGFLTIQGLSNGTGAVAAGTALSATVKLSPGLDSTFVILDDPFEPGVEIRSVLAGESISFDFRLTEASVSFEDGRRLVTDPDGVVHDVTGATAFTFADGSFVEQDGYALVDDLFYYARNPDVWAAHNDGRGVDADTHYLNGGWSEGRDPNAFFSSDGYLAANPDVAAAGVNPLIHFQNGGWSEGRSPDGLGLAEEPFSIAAYLAAYADVRAAGVDPLAHYLAADPAEGRIAFAHNLGRGPIGDFDI